MSVKTIQPTFDEGNQNISKNAPPGHPLVVVATSMEVWPVELCLGKGGLEPPEGIDVANMHAEGNLSLFAVSSEVPLAEQQAQHKPFVKGIHRATFHGKHDGETILREVS